MPTSDEMLITLRLLDWIRRVYMKNTDRVNILSTVSVISLGQHDAFSNKSALFNGAEADDISNTRVCLLVSMCDTHASTDGNVEASQLAVIPNDSDKAKIICEDVNIIRRRHGNSDFELKTQLTSRFCG